MTSQWDAQMEAFGAFVRSQRKLANLTLRQLADMTSLSNPYLSELERGMHQPSVRVLKQLADALNVSAEMLLAHAGLIDRQATSQPAEDDPVSSARSGRTRRSTTRRRPPCWRCTRA